MIPWDWNATPQERAARFPSDDYLDPPVRRLTRAMTIAAPPPAVFRWLCQLRWRPTAMTGSTIEDGRVLALSRLAQNGSPRARRSSCSTSSSSRKDGA